MTIGADFNASLLRPAASPSSLARSGCEWSQIGQPSAARCLTFQPGSAGSEWSQIDLDAAMLHVCRVKSGKPATHPIRGDELRALRKLQRQEPKATFVFVSHRVGTRFKDFWR
jgi:hypothetical protein